MADNAGLPRIVSTDEAGSVTATFVPSFVDGGLGDPDAKQGKKGLQNVVDGQQVLWTGEIVKGKRVRIDVVVCSLLYLSRFCIYSRIFCSSKICDDCCLFSG